MKEKREKKSITQYVLRAVSVMLPLLLIIAPTEVHCAAALLSACIAFPQGGYALAMNYITAQEGGAQSVDSRQTQQNESAVAVGNDITQTPQDILSLMESARAAAADDKYDADIAAKTYGKGGATSIYENVYVKNTTSTKSLNIERTLGENLGLVIEDRTKPCVLIYHTHTTEGFELFDREWYAQDSTSRTTNASQSIVRVGTEIAGQIEKAGFVVIHDTTIHDEPYSGAYKRSRKTVQEYLDKYPEIQLTLDIHRDSMQENDGTKIKPVANIDGKQAAQLMIIAGAQEGEITDFPNWKTNLCFALRLHKLCEDMSPGLMRPTLFCQRKYNMDMTGYSLLIEVGSEANTLEEAAYSGRLLGRALAQLLETACRT